MSRSSTRDPLRKRLRRARIRAIHHIQLMLQLRLRLLARGLLSAARGGLLRERDESRGGRNCEGFGGALARDGVNEEVLGLDGERLLELELVRGVVHDEIETLKDGDERELRFLPCERAALECA